MPRRAGFPFDRPRRAPRPQAPAGWPHTGTRCKWKPACPAYSQPKISATAPSNGSPLLSAKELPPSSSPGNTSTRRQRPSPDISSHNDLSIRLHWLGCQPPTSTHIGRLLARRSLTVRGRTAARATGQPIGSLINDALLHDAPPGTHPCRQDQLASARTQAVAAEPTRHLFCQTCASLPTATAPLLCDTKYPPFGAVRGSRAMIANTTQNNQSAAQERLIMSDR
jgi:hypothetical protein